MSISAISGMIQNHLKVWYVPNTINLLNTLCFAIVCDCPTLSKWEPVDDVHVADNRFN